MTQYTRKGSGQDWGQPYGAMARQLQNIIEKELRVAGVESAAEAVAFIDIAGTQNAWFGTFKGRTQSNRGRRDTDTMRDSISYRIARGKDISLDVGWPHRYEEYFGAQDQGFSAPGFRANEQWVEGMGMMAHLKTYARDRVDLAMDRAMKEIANGL